MDPNFEAKAAFAAHWAGVTVTRSNPTFDGVPPNHDHLVVIPDPSKKTRSRTAAAVKAPSVVSRIPVVFAVR
jgi:hypothetical protein